MMPFVGPPEPETAIAAHLARQAAREEQARSLPIGWQVGPVAASLFDAIATDDALNRGRESGLVDSREANPVMAPFAHNDVALYATKIGTGILAGLAAKELAKRGHPTAARIVSGLNIGIPLVAGAHNLASGRR